MGTYKRGRQSFVPAQPPVIAAWAAVRWYDLPLRRKLTVGDETPLIETVVGRGYRLRDTVAAASA